MATKKALKFNIADTLLISLIIGMLVLIILKVIPSLRNSGNNNNNNNNNSGGNAGGSTTPTPAAIDYDLKLKFGSRGQEVRILQNWINRDGGKDSKGRKLVEDGIFGQNTKDALYNLKGKTELSLNQYRVTPDKNSTAANNTGIYLDANIFDV